MTSHADLTQVLLEMGFTKPHADAYIELLRLAGQGPVKGFDVAKALGKDPTSVYKALDELVSLEIVQREEAGRRKKSYFPVAPREVLRQRERRMADLGREALPELENLGALPDAGTVFRLMRRDKVLGKFEELLAASERVALLDLAPFSLAAMRPRIEEAIARGVEVVAKLYREDEGELTGATIVVEPEPAMLEIMPGPLVHGVFDCGSQLVAYLPADDDQDLVPQAFWTDNAFLAYQAHSGLASEIMQTRLRRMIVDGADAGSMDDEVARLSALMHGPVDWDQFWRDTGFVSAQGDPDWAANVSRHRRKLPWRKDEVVESIEAPMVCKSDCSSRLVNDLEVSYDESHSIFETIAKRKRALIDQREDSDHEFDDPETDQDP